MPFVRRVDVDERVALPGARARGIGVAAPEVDDAAGRRRTTETAGADLLVAREARGERVAHRREARVAVSFDRRARHPGLRCGARLRGAKPGSLRLRWPACTDRARASSRVSLRPPAAEARVALVPVPGSRAAGDQGRRRAGRADPGSAGAALLRRQFLGLLGARPCWSGELAPDAEPPPGMTLPRPALALRAAPAGAPRRRRPRRADRRVGPQPSVLRRLRRADAEPRRASARAPARAAASRTTRASRPSMIVAVERDGALLLARAPHFPRGIYSVLAGFVEPGESVEETVAREVIEETGHRGRGHPLLREPALAVTRTRSCWASRRAGAPARSASTARDRGRRLVPPRRHAPDVPGQHQHLPVADPRLPPPA